MFDDTPEQVVILYHDIIGQPALIPRWALGWQYSGQGYKNIEEFKQKIA